MLAFRLVTCPVYFLTVSAAVSDRETSAALFHGAPLPTDRALSTGWGTTSKTMGWGVGGNGCVLGYAVKVGPQFTANALE